MKKMKIFCLLLVTIMIVGLFHGTGVEAAKKPSKPKITVKLVKGDTGVKVTVGKTKNADGYEVWVTQEGDDLYKGYSSCWFAPEEEREVWTDEWDEYDMPIWEKVKGFCVYLGESYGNIKEIAKNGKKARNVTLTNLLPGKHKIKVRAYRIRNGEKVYGSYSAVKTVTTRAMKGGYKNSYDFSNVSVGETIKFGAYEQDYNFTNGSEPIEWVVLDKTGSSIKLISKYSLDTIGYEWISDEEEDQEWDNCNIRKWLNENFYNTAFNSYEKKMITETLLDKSVTDKVFLLSVSEAVEYGLGYISSADGTVLKNILSDATEYAKRRDATDGWWLRSPGGISGYACSVANLDGYITEYAYARFDLRYSYDGIRPAICIKF